MSHIKYLMIFVCLFASHLYCEYQYITKYEGTAIYEKFSGRPLEIIDKVIPENPMIFEAGGHYGVDTIKFAKKWPHSTIISFEPNPHAFEKHLETTRDFSNIHGFHLAVNNYNGTAILNVCYGTTGDDPIFEGASSLLEASEGMKIHYQGPKVEVPCVVLDDWCRENGVENIDFMWLDLEGLELQILKCSPKILKTVKVIYTETNFYKFRKGTTKYKDLRAFLQKSGFKVLAHWYNENLQGNAIFVRQELYPLALK